MPKCQSCGCTDEDCRQCIEKTGVPCFWIECNLCSACAPIGRKVELLSLARNITSCENWRATTEHEDNAVFGELWRDGSFGPVLVASGLDPRDALFLQLTHQLLPELLAEYHRLKGFHDHLQSKKERFSV